MGQDNNSLLLEIPTDPFACLVGEWEQGPKPSVSVSLHNWKVKSQLELPLPLNSHLTSKWQHAEVRLTHDTLFLFYF